MSIISDLANAMVKSQSFDFNSFQEAKATVEHKYRGKTLSITYDRLSLFIYSKNLTALQYWRLGRALRAWLTNHNNEDHKKRIEYGILFQYAVLHPEYQHAQITKSVRPDFVVELDGEIIGIEVTRLEKESDSIMSRILDDLYKPGMKPNEVIDLAFKKHGYKALEYKITEFQKDVLAIQHIDDMLITTEGFVDIIGRKINKYKDKSPEFDKFIVLCNAQHGITITSETDANNLLEDTFEVYSKPEMNIAVMYLSQNNTLQCAEYKSQVKENDQ